MLTDEDRRRLVEARHDIAACEKVADLSPVPSLQAAVSTSRYELAAADSALRAAVALVSKEHGETDAERAKLGLALSPAVRRYGFVRGKVQDALLNVDPDTDLSPNEIVRRQNLVSRIFRIAPSDLEKLGQGSIIELISGVAQSLEKEADLAPLGLAQSLANAHANAEKASKELHRETTEDAQAMTSLRNAREAFDRSASAHALQVESILVRHNRKDDIGHFILAQDPAYAARRAAKLPIADEPGAGDIETPPTKTGG